MHRCEKNIGTTMNTVISMIAASSSSSTTTPITEALTSHSVRSGALNYIGFCNEIPIHWALMRAGYNLDGLATIFTYLSGTYRNDAPVGRTLSFWPNPMSGGIIQLF